MILVLKQIQEKCSEQNMSLYAALVDLTKAFDAVGRDGLWKILTRLGCPPKIFTTFRHRPGSYQGQMKHNLSLLDSSPSLLASSRDASSLLPCFPFPSGEQEAPQHIDNRFSDAAKNFGFTISLKKIEVLYQPPPREAYSPPHISIDGTDLKAVEHFTYLDNVISNDASHQGS